MSKPKLLSLPTLTLVAALFVSAFAVASPVAPLAQGPQRPQPATPPAAGPRMFGLTVDDVCEMKMPAIIDGIKAVKGQSSARPMVRVVFDFREDIFEAHKENFEPEHFAEEVAYYRRAIEKIKPHADVMGELIDSSAVYRCHYDKEPTRCYEARAVAYARGLGDLVDVWEIGNEVNGEWVGWQGDSWGSKDVTVEQMAAMRDRVALGIKATDTALKGVIPNAKTALTFYYNSDTVNHSWTDEKKKDASGQMVKYGENYDILTWAQHYRGRGDLPEVTYVLLSYYEDDNKGVRPNRKKMEVSGLVKVLAELARSFSGAQLGFGEFAPQCHYDDCDHRACKKCKDAQASYIPRYYITLDELVRAALAKPESGWDARRAYVGGYFYWYFNGDVVDSDNPRTLEALSNAFAQYTAVR